MKDNTTLKRAQRAKSIKFSNKSLTIKLLKSFRVNKYLESYGVRDSSTEVNFFQYPFLFN